jgi:hypothetical protein
MAHMNGGFEKHGLDENAFGPEGGFSNLKTFDAFRKSAPTRCFAACFAILSHRPLCLQTRQGMVVPEPSSC